MSMKFENYIYIDDVHHVLDLDSSTMCAVASRAAACV